MSQKFELKNASHNIRKIQFQNFCMKQYEKKRVLQNKKKINNENFINLILCKTYIVDVIFKKSTFSQFIFVITFFQQKTFYPHFILKFQIIHYFRSAALKIFVNNRAHSSERSEEQTKVQHEVRGVSESGLPKASIKNDTMKHTEQ